MPRRPDKRSLRGFAKETPFDQLLAGLEQSFGSDCNEAGNISLGDWALKSHLFVDREEFSFVDREYLIEPYNDLHPNQVEQKATQLGLTIKATLRTFFSARFRGFKKGVLYLFPSRSDVTEFVKGRVDPFVEENAETIGPWIKDTDAANIKKIWNCVVYFRGMKSRVGLKSVPIDMIVFDELDEAPQNMVDMANERMAASVHKETLKLSNPTLPDYGINRAFIESDMRHWMIKCKACGEYTCLEDDFAEAISKKDLPKCILELTDGRIIRACKKCHREIDPSNGLWVPKRPGITDVRGYQYSQLFSKTVAPAEILKKYQTTRNMQDFVNLKIGLPYIEAENRLSVEEVLSLSGSHGIESADNGPCCMGVDQGKGLHVVIGHGNFSNPVVLHLNEYEDWEELDNLMKNFNIFRAVVDAQPEMRKAREFAKRFPGKVFLNFYKDHQRGRYLWNEKDHTVSCNRTESMDASHLEILKRSIVFPRYSEVMKTFAEHMHNVAKKLEEDEDSGSRRYVYVRLGVDHYRHAFNYFIMALQFGQDSLFGGQDLR